MLRITRQRQFRVSNRTAIMAALLLVVTTAAGLGNAIDTPERAPNAIAETSREAPASETPTERAAAATARSKKFRVNLYLFRRN